MISIVEERHDIEALEKFRSQRMRGAENSNIRGGIGVIPVRGPLFKHANLMTEHCGATSYEGVLRDFQTMLDSPTVKSIVFDIDSPGGEANGCSEIADHIFAARGQKQITAYIGGTGASAAYWIASACDRVVAADSAIIGSIGVQSAMRAGKENDEIRFVSSQSPNKNRDPSTEDGAREVQAVIDSLAEVFIGKVARNRGVDRETVMQKFGQGSVFVGAESQKRGLIDEISTLEDLISNLGAHSEMVTSTISAEFIAKNHPEIAEHFIKIGAAREQDRFREEKARVEKIHSLAEGQVPGDFIQSLIDRGVTVQDAAVEILLETRKNPRQTWQSARKEHDQTLSGLNTPPVQTQDENAKLASSQDSAIELARKLGLTGVAR